MARNPMRQKWRRLQVLRKCLAERRRPPKPGAVRPVYSQLSLNVIAMNNTLKLLWGQNAY